MMRSPMVSNRKESLIAKAVHRENRSLIAFIVVFAAVDELSLLYYFENYPPSTKQQPSKRAAVPFSEFLSVNCKAPFDLPTY